MSMPRAAMSVAIITRHSPDLKSFMAFTRAFCDLLPWMAHDRMPARFRILASLSAPCFVRENTSTCWASDAESRSISSWRMPAARIMASQSVCAASGPWERFMRMPVMPASTMCCKIAGCAQADAGGVTVTSTGLRRIFAASAAIDSGIVAEKKSV